MGGGALILEGESGVDINQASQMISWLDEEHRRDKAQLTELRQRLESQTIELTDQAKRIQDLEGRVATTQGKLGRFNTLEQAIQNSRDEIVLMVRALEEELVRYQREHVKLRQAEQENTSRSINELRRNLEAIPPLHERIATLKAEDQRLGEIVLNLQTRTTAHERQTASLPDRIVYVEGQRAQDLKATSKIQEEVVELMRRTETLAGKHELVEDIARKNEQRVTALGSFREELVKRQAQLSEDVRLKEAQVDRQIQEVKSVIAHFEEAIGKQRAVLERFAHRQEEAQQYLAAIEEYKDTLNREQRQVNELQRMSEERQRRELQEWMAADQQRWTKFQLERESQWHQVHSRHEEVVTRLHRLEEWRDDDLDRMRDLSKDLIRIQEEYRAKLRDLWAIQERAAIFQLDETRRWYDQISAVVAEKLGTS